MAINGSVINKTTINGADSNIFVQALTYVSTSATNFAKAVAKFFSLITDTTLSFITETAFHLVMIAYYSITTNTIVKAVSTSFSYLSTNTTSLLKQVNKYLSYLSTSTSSISKVINKFITYLSSSTSTIIKAVSTTLSYLSSSASNVYKGLFNTLSYLANSSSTVIKTVGKGLTYLSTSSLSIVKAVSKIFATITDTTLSVITERAFHLVALAVINVSTSTIGKAVSKTMTFLGTSFVQIPIVRAKLLLAYIQGLPITGNISGAVNGAVNSALINLNAINSGVGNAITYLNSYYPSITKQVNKAYSILSTSTASMLHFKIWVKVLLIFSISVATVQTALIRAITLLSTSVSNSLITKHVLKILSVVQYSVLTLFANFIQKFGAVATYTFIVQPKKLMVSFSKDLDVVVKAGNKYISIVKNNIITLWNKNG